MNGNLYDQSAQFGSSVSGATKSGGVLNLDFYTGYFDVDTVTVITRCYKTLLPREDYVMDVLAGVPDLYGPFWVPTTLIFSLFLTSSLTSSITAYLAGESYTYDFTRLGAAVSLVCVLHPRVCTAHGIFSYAYALGLPVLVWVALKYWANVYERSAVEIVSIYGYSTTIWIIVSVRLSPALLCPTDSAPQWLSLIPYTPLRVLLALGGTGVSLAFILRNLYPVISTSPNVSSRLLILVVGVLHLALSLGLWFGFMASGGGKFSPPTTGGGLPVGDGTGEVVEAALRLLL